MFDVLSAPRLFVVCCQHHGCLRVKLSGDCYNCISGLPEKEPGDVDRCVKMGLDMIDVIRYEKYFGDIHLVHFLTIELRRLLITLS